MSFISHPNSLPMHFQPQVSNAGTNILINNQSPLLLLHLLLLLLLVLLLLLAFTAPVGFCLFSLLLYFYFWFFSFFWFFDRFWCFTFHSQFSGLPTYKQNSASVTTLSVWLIYSVVWLIYSVIASICRRCISFSCTTQWIGIRGREFLSCARKSQVWSAPFGRRSLSSRRRPAYSFGS